MKRLIMLRDSPARRLFAMAGPNARCGDCGELLRANLDTRDEELGPVTCPTCDSPCLYPYEPEQSEPTGTNAKGWES